MRVYEYSGELFWGSCTLQGIFRLRTRIQQKASTFGFRKDSERNGWYLKEVSENDCTYVKDVPDRYYVRYKGHFFHVIEETRNEVKLILKELNSPQQYEELGFHAFRAQPSTKWVKRSEVTTMEEISERVGWYTGTWHFPDKGSISGIFYIIDEDETHYMMKADSYIADEAPPDEWVSKNEVFEFNKSNEPLFF